LASFLNKVNNKERNPFDLSSTKFAQRGNTTKKRRTGNVALAIADRAVLGRHKSERA
jgi:hypothetical protein